MKRISLVLLIIILGFYSSAQVWGDSPYIYRQRVNWVKIDKASPKEFPLHDLKHPYTALTPEQMEAMLFSIKISKRYTLKKEIDSVDVFSSWEARKYAPYLVEALAKAEPEQVVSFSIVHKRPFFILRNDRLTMGNLFVASDGIHFQFTKLFAKLEGDYEASGHMDKAVRNAKTMRVTLEAQAGQQLSYASATEVILDPNYNFLAQVEQYKAEEKAQESKEMKGSGAIEERLGRLEDLKKQKLITEKEYQDLRKKILSEI